MRLASGIVGVAGLPLLGACSPVGRDTKNESIAEPAKPSQPLVIDPALREALYHASLAPSSHNVQPWLVRVLNSEHLTFHVDAKRRLPAVDPDNRELLLGMGAFLENFIIAAGVHGLQVSYQTVAKKSDDVDLLDISCSATGSTPDSLDRITSRCTVRNGQSTRVLAAADVNALVHIVGDGAVFFPRGSSQAKYLDEGTIEANRVQAARDAAQIELAEWIRTSDDDARAHRDGLTPTSMGITGLAGFYARYFMNPQSMITPENRARGVDAARKQVQEGGGWFVITSADADVSTLIETGRRFERLLLSVRERNIAVHPMTQMLEELPSRNELASRLGVAPPIQFLLRVGYVDRYPAPVSLRRPLSWFIERGAPA